MGMKAEVAVSDCEDEGEGRRGEGERAGECGGGRRRSGLLKAFELVMAINSAPFFESRQGAS